MKRRSVGIFKDEDMVVGNSEWGNPMPLNHFLIKAQVWQKND
jgi:hypothetical protein